MFYLEITQNVGTDKEAASQYSFETEDEMLIKYYQEMSYGMQMCDGVTCIARDGKGKLYHVTAWVKNEGTSNIAGGDII